MSTIKTQEQGVNVNIEMEALLLLLLLLLHYVLITYLNVENSQT